MKRLFTLALGAVMLASCSTDNGGQLTFDTLNISREVSLEKTDDSPQCKVNISLHYMNSGSKMSKAINNAIESRLFDMRDLSMRQAADSFANEYTREYLKAMRPLYREDRADASKRSWYEYHYNISTKVKEGRQDVTVYIISSDYYEGGVHGIDQQFVMNFDNKTGRQLTLSDVFVPGYENRLNAILLKTLEKKTDAKGITELQEHGYLCATEIFAPDNFIMGDDDITFIYNVYEIAPYEKGRTELTISYSDIDDLLKK